MKFLINKIKKTRLYRYLITVIRIPFIFISLRGHIKQDGWLSVNKDGKFVPWISYPAADFLDNLDTSKLKIFEYGSGSSTFWWSKKALSITSVEMDKEWYEYMLSILPLNAELHLCENGFDYPYVIEEFKHNFDIIVVDGAERYKSAKAAINKLVDNGIIILDNADWYPNTAKMLRTEGFKQIDFYGFSPMNSFPECTSLFIQDLEIFSKRQKQNKSVIGGNTIKGGTLDDKDY